MIINLTAVETNPEGYLAAYPDGIAFPGTSTLNWSTSGDIIANTTSVRVTNGKIRIRCAGSAHVIVDVVGGYYDL